MKSSAKARLAIAATAVTASAAIIATVAALSGPAGASTASGSHHGSAAAMMSSSHQSSSAATMSSSYHGYSFTTIDNNRDLTFNQLLGINSAGEIAGYFGSGMSGHPNKGYTTRLPYHQASFRNENFPHSAQTQVTGLNDFGNTAGFWANAKGANFGFYTQTNGRFHEVNFPNVPNSSPQMDQLLGINDSGLAVGFYTNSAGNARGYTYNIHTGRFKKILVPGIADTVSAPSITATAINNHNWITGFYTNHKGVTVAFVKYGSHFRTFAYHGASMTQAFGINDSGEVVGAYTVGSGNSAKTYGFTWTMSHGFTVVNDPHGIGSTLINGLNDRGELVGFYTDSAGNTDGFLARPKG